MIVLYQISLNPLSLAIFSPLRIMKHIAGCQILSFTLIDTFSNKFDFFQNRCRHNIKAISPTNIDIPAIANMAV